jgi:hypothetical protein
MFWVPMHHAGGVNLERLLVVKIKWLHLVDSTSIVICSAVECHLLLILLPNKYSFITKCSRSQQTWWVLWCLYINWGKKTGSHREIWRPGAVSCLRFLVSHWYTDYVCTYDASCGLSLFTLSHVFPSGGNWLKTSHSSRVRGVNRQFYHQARPYRNLAVMRPAAKCGRVRKQLLTNKSSLTFLFACSSIVFTLAKWLEDYTVGFAQQSANRTSCHVTPAVEKCVWIVSQNIRMKWLEA